MASEVMSGDCVAGAWGTYFSHTGYESRHGESVSRRPGPARTVGPSHPPRHRGHCGEGLERDEAGVHREGVFWHRRPRPAEYGLLAADLSGPGCLPTRMAEAGQRLRAPLQDRPPGGSLPCDEAEPHRNHRRYRTAASEIRRLVNAD